MLKQLRVLLFVFILGSGIFGFINMNREKNNIPNLIHKCYKAIKKPLDFYANGLIQAQL